MDPRHRDRVAFVRVCSGRFTKDMVVSNSRVGKPLRASRAYRFFGRDRETISVAYAGDIIGLVNPGQFAIGDTLHTGAPLRFLDVPRFPAEHFGRVRLQDTRYKQFDEGLRQLEEEGLMQVFYVDRRPPRADRRRRRRAAVRRDCQPPAQRVRRGGRDRARGVHGRSMARECRRGRRPRSADRASSPWTARKRRVLLFGSEWELQYFERQHPDVPLLAESPVAAPTTSRS